jgi:hypothetical protein
MSKIISNKVYKIIDTIVWTLAIVGMIVMVCALYELNEVQKEVKELKVIMRK